MNIRENANTKGRELGSKHLITFTPLFFFDVINKNSRKNAPPITPSRKV